MITVRQVPAISLFSTDLFRKSAWIQDLCEKIGQAWVTEDELPGGHFGNYFGALSVRRQYDNKHVQDDYHLHELIHLLHFRYDPRISWHAWAQRMIRGEFAASMVSEVEAYFRIPGLRERTFKHAIWADRFLQEYGSLPDKDVSAVMRLIAVERERALNAPRFDDYLEHQIHNYRLQNVRWCQLWAEPVRYGKYRDRPAFRVVEEHMAGPDRDKTHEQWIKDLTPDCGEIPFANQAAAFEPIYKQTVETFGNHFLVA